MTKTLPLTQVASLIWNDAACECYYQHSIKHDPSVPFSDAVPCEDCLVQTWEEKVSECGDEFLDSIEDIGIVHPIILNTEGTRVMNGHHRLAYAIMAMLSEVPVAYGYENDTSDESELPYSYA